MSAYVLLNLLSVSGKRDKMRGFSSILSPFRNEFNKNNDTGARMLDYIYHMTLKIIKNPKIGVKCQDLGVFFCFVFLFFFCLQRRKIFIYNMILDLDLIKLMNKM